MVGASVPWSGGSLVSLPRAAPNQALEPTAYSFGFATLCLRFRRRLTASVRRAIVAWKGVGMRRRDFLTLLGGAAASVAWPLAARAQQPGKVARLGHLRFGPASAYAARVETLRTGLRDLGYVEGQNLVMEFRWAATVDQLSEMAAELVRLPVDLIFAASSTEVEAVRHLTTTIPIVFAVHADPVGLGHVASFPRPGGNITGLTDVQTDLAAKRLELLQEVVPHATRFGVVFSPTAPSHAPVLQAVAVAGAQLGVALHTVAVHTVEDFDGAFATLARERVGGVFVVASPLTASQHPARLAELALQHRLPSMFAYRLNVEAGGLMSYAADHGDLIRRAATYIDKILKGAKPADLPVERASKYELAINLTTAQAIGLTIPPTLLFQADKVIQ
jgi:putative tryptophan/tyrosine transport system substrate-binding protein